MQSMNTRQWAVGELTGYIRELFETDYRLQNLEVIGEVSNLRVPSSGHAYFTMKDAKAQLKCVMWGYARRPAGSYEPSNGEQIIAQGYLSLYEASGEYQLYCRQIKPAGVGDLHARFEALKARLYAEGLFDPTTKASLPTAPRIIGLVTSPSTAALQDVLNVLGRRDPSLRVILSPASVQGEAAPPQIIEALRRLETYAGQDRLDAILIVRGGGSLEDLWCFNEEGVARTIAEIAENIPVISGVGHEIDFTLADFAASLRAPTPSAAAELITPVTAEDHRLHISALADRATDALRWTVEAGRHSLNQSTQRLGRVSPLAAIDQARQHIDALLDRGDRATRQTMTLKRLAAESNTHALATVSPVRTLDRGYAIVYREDGTILKNPTQVQRGDRVNVQVSKGRITATVEQTLDENTNGT